MLVQLIRRKQNKVSDKENTDKPVLKRREKPKLQRRLKPKLVRRSKPKLQRRLKPDVFYCAKKSIKNRLPYPIECSWVGSMYLCCRICTKKISYGKWREGGYSAIAKELENRTYREETRTDQTQENPTNFMQEEQG